MKNKVIGILIALVVIIGVMASQVNAADMSVNSTEVKVGDTVTVTLKLEKPTQSIGLDLTYDANSFEYVKGSVTSDLPSLTVNDTVAGSVKISAADATQTTTYITYTFVAKENTDAASFVASGLNTINGEGLDVDTVSVKVVEPTVEPEPEDPTPVDPENPDVDVPSDVTDNTQAGDKVDANAPKVDEDGNVITKLPQTGVTVFQIAGVVAIVVIAGALAVRKLRK